MAFRARRARREEAERAVVRPCRILPPRRSARSSGETKVEAGLEQLQVWAAGPRAERVRPRAKSQPAGFWDSMSARGRGCAGVRPCAARVQRTGADLGALRGRFSKGRLLHAQGSGGIELIRCGIRARRASLPQDLVDELRASDRVVGARGRCAGRERGGGGGVGSCSGPPSRTRTGCGSGEPGFAAGRRAMTHLCSMFAVDRNRIAPRAVARNRDPGSSPSTPGTLKLRVCVQVGDPASGRARARSPGAISPGGAESHARALARAAVASERLADGGLRGSRSQPVRDGRDPVVRGRWGQACPALGPGFDGGWTLLGLSRRRTDGPFGSERPRAWSPCGRPGRGFLQLRRRGDADAGKGWRMSADARAPGSRCRARRSWARNAPGRSRRCRRFSKRDGAAGEVEAQVLTQAAMLCP